MFRFMFSILLFASVLPAMAEEAGPEGDGEDSWSVQDPPGDWQAIEIDAEEVSWATVDVSPDGEFLIFDFLGDLYRLSIDGGDAVALTEGIAWDFQPRFSPDGSRIAFISDRSGAENVWTMNTDGEDMHQVSDESDQLLHNPAWTPDGDFIAARKGYVSRRSIPAGSIWLYHRSGGSGVELVERLHGDASQKNIAEPAFSPDGRHLYYSQDITDGTTWQYNKDANQGVFAIRRLDRETGETENVVSGPGGAVRPVVSPGICLDARRRIAGAVEPGQVAESWAGRRRIDHRISRARSAQDPPGAAPGHRGLDGAGRGQHAALEPRIAGRKTGRVPGAGLHLDTRSGKR
ncbi:MAG: hypothetical protein LC637_07425 [Xanthomonadaceae bacterium]|nr:hypothetical protein [Xanthomonadaceae bacterium]